MSTKVHWLTHRGALRALASDGDALYFVTTHAEGQPTALFRLDPNTAALAEQPLPGGVDVASAGSGRWLVAGTDGHVWAGAFGAMAPLGEALEPAPSAIAPLAADHVAVITGAVLLVLNGSGAEVARFGLPNVGTALATDPTGHWIVAGCRDGTVAVFSDEGDAGFVAHESAALHAGEVFALRFDPDELRFRSSGNDSRFLVTHARGTLESIDRGGSHSHKKPMRGMVGDGDLVYTVGEDKEIKAWRRDNRRQPATQKRGVGVAVALAEVTFDGQPHLAVASDDDAIRLFPLDAEGKVADRVALFNGAMASVQHELSQKETDRRKAAIDLLTTYADAESIELLAISAVGDDDHPLRVHATEQLGRIDNPRAVPALEQLLRTDTEAVRWAALAGLRGHVGAEDLRPLKLAIEARYPDIGMAAVEALLSPAASDERAHVLLVGALNHTEKAVREAALLALETLHPTDASASWLGLRSTVASLRWLALLRLLQRDLLADADRPLRGATEDADADVRQIAYHLRLMIYPNLCGQLRHLDADLHRNLHSLETHGQAMQEVPPVPGAPSAPPETLTPLVQATSSRQRDTCLRGASHLAALGDGRAFGVLLQLSREGEPDIQVRACRALQRLDDPRALGRMQAMLRSTTDQVRDAAFTTIHRLLDDALLQTAEIGLSAPHADVRSRGLAVLTEILNGGLPADPEDPAFVLLRRGLDDAEAKIRQDAFKSTLRLEVGGSAEGALRFGLQSLHGDVRRDVQTEIMSEIRQDWAWRLLLERFDDPNRGLRDEAFAFARKQGKGRDPDAVVAALRSDFSDLRLQAVVVLSGRVDDRARPLLIEALDDDAEEVRKQAFDALQRAGQTEAMVAALSSRHADVRIGAAASLAEAGRMEALRPLIDQVETPMPEVTDLAKLWKGYLLRALTGLAWLGSPEAVGPVAVLLDDSDADIRSAAARTLAFAAADPEVLRSRLQHSDKRVSYTLALGLAWRGDPTGSALIFGKNGRGPDRASAAVGLGDDEQLLALLDASDAKVRTLVLRVVLLMEWVAGDFPHRLLAALTVADPRVRLAVAEVLEAWNDPDALGRAIATKINKTGEQPEWPVDISLLRRIALTLSHGTGLQRASAISVLKLWDMRARSTSDAQDAADVIAHRWALVEARSHGEIAAIRDPGHTGGAEITDLVFGTYIGLGGQVQGSAGEAVRAWAVGRIGRLPGVPSGPRIDALIPALADDRGPVRLAAFQALQSAGLGTEQLAAESLATGQRDLGQQALTLIADTGGVDELWRVLAAREDGLELVAFDLLNERVGEEQAAKASLDARSEKARNRGVATLSARYDTGPAEQETLRDALQSRFPDVRRWVALALASHRDASAFDALAGLLSDDDHQQDGIRGLVKLDDPRVGGVLLDRLDNDPRGTARANALYAAVGDLRSADHVPRLLGRLRAHDDQAGQVIKALTTISGYDQRLVFDVAEPDADESWLVEQHPRNDEVFAKVLQLHADRRDARALGRLFAGATWARGAEIDLPLQRMLHHAEDAIRRNATLALGWRVRFRNADDEPLRQVLAHKDPETSFYAAEGLARAGASAGLSVLLAAIDTLDDLRLRSRAVLALGHLADPRALDKLLDIADNVEHALVESAAEAIGHLRNTPQRERILTRLLQLSRGPAINVASRALVGLRWFGSPDAWTRIRRAAADSNVRLRMTAADLLRHDTSATSVESREVLEGLVIEDRYAQVVRAAAVSLRRLCGADSLEPDYVFLRARVGNLEDDTIPRLRERGDAERILQALADPACRSEHIEPLLLALASRDPLPVDSAIARLTDPRPKGGALAARLLGRAPALSTPQLEALQAAADAALVDWSDRRDRGDALDAAADRVGWMLWAAARQGVGGPLVVRCLELDGPGSAPLRKAAAQALPLLSNATEQLLHVARTGDARARSMAAGTLVRIDRALAEEFASGALDDRAAVEPILSAGVRPATLAAAAAQVHVQGVALPHVVAAGDVDALSGALQSPIDTVRMGALEALGVIGTPTAEDALRAYGVDEEREEDERKVAWRALRRSKRQRARQEAAR